MYLTGRGWCGKKAFVGFETPGKGAALWGGSVRPKRLMRPLGGSVRLKRPKGRFASGCTVESDRFRFVVSHISRKTSKIWGTRRRCGFRSRQFRPYWEDPRSQERDLGHPHLVFFRVSDSERL